MNKIKNIAICGAGITGLTSTHILAKNGYKTTLFSPEIGHASAIAGGMLSPYSEIEHMPPAWVKAGLSSIQFWSQLSQNHDIGFAQNGSYIAAHNEDRYILERFKTHLPHDIYEQKSKLDRTKVSSHLWVRNEAHLDPQKTLSALKTGQEIREQRVTPEDLSNKFDLVIDCRGMGAVDNDPDLRGVKGEILTVLNPEFTLNAPLRLMHPRYPLYIIPRGNGVFVIGASNIESADNTEVSLRSAMELMSALYSLHPSFGDAQILKLEAGIRPAYPDNLPRITKDNNIYRLNGLFRHGYLLAPAMALCLLDMIKGQDNEFSDLFTRSQHENNNQRAA